MSAAHRAERSRQSEQLPASADQTNTAEVHPSAALAQSQEIHAVVDRQVHLGAGHDTELKRVPQATAERIEAQTGCGQGLDSGTRNQMEAAFGADFSDVRVHADGRSDQMAKSLDASAFTSGNNVFFRGGQYSPGSSGSARLLAHELAHVIQHDGSPTQRVQQLSQPGDRREAAADKAANMAMARLSGERTNASPVEASLEGGGDRGAVQRRVWTGSKRTKRDSAGGTLLVPSGLSGVPLKALLEGSDGKVSMKSAWDKEIRPAICRHVGVDLTALDDGIEKRCLSKLTDWCKQPTGRENFKAGVTKEKNDKASSEERRYLNADHLAIALVAESDPKYKKRLEVETKLAEAVAKSSEYTGAFDRMLSAYGAKLSKLQIEELGMLAANSRYKQFSELKNAKGILASPSGTDMGSKCILADEITKYAASKMTPKYEDFRKSVFKELGRYRENGYTVAEDHKWVKEARALGVPLSAGPSDTTAKVLGLAKSCGMSNKDMFKIAWCMFAFYNGMWRGYSATHRLHEVMAAASLYFDPAKEGYVHSIKSLP